MASGCRSPSRVQLRPEHKPLKGKNDDRGLKELDDGLNEESRRMGLGNLGCS